jgi:hypothetical protein
MTPPFILACNASSVPILQLALSREMLPDAHIFDIPTLRTLPGVSASYLW